MRPPTKEPRSLQWRRACRVPSGLRRLVRDATQSWGVTSRGRRRRTRYEQPLGRGFAPRVDRDAERARDGPRVMIAGYPYLRELGAPRYYPGREYGPR